MFNLFKRRRKQPNIAQVDVERGDGTLYLIREYEQRKDGVYDRTVAIYTTKDSAIKSVQRITQQRFKNKQYHIEQLNYIQHKNSLISK